MTFRRAVFLLFFLGSGNVFGFTLQQSGLHGWSVKQITVNINFASCPISREALEDVVDQAFDAWNAVAMAHVQLVRGSNSATTAAQAFAGTALDSPVIVCDSAMSATIGANSDQVAVYADIQQTAGSISYGYLLINAEVGKAKNILNLSGIQQSIALAHGIGHMLGLGHSSDQNSLMFYNYTTKENLRLSQDDIDGIIFLYRRVEPDEDKVFGCAGVEPTGGRQGPTFLYALVFLFAVLAVLKRVYKNVSV